jgi:hypothetical protein
MTVKTDSGWPELNTHWRSERGKGKRLVLTLAALKGLSGKS